MVLYDDFMREMHFKNRAGKTIGSFEQSLNKAQEALDKPLEDFSFDELLTYIEGTKKTLSPNSVSLHTSKFIQFYKFAFDKTEDIKYEKMVKNLKKINTGFEKNNIKPSDLLNTTDIKKLINVATLERDRCIVATLFESGMRRGELLSLSNNNVKMDDDRKLVTFEIPNIEGNKTGSRVVVCSEIHGYVTDWLRCNTSNMFMPISEAGLKLILIRLFKKAGIDDKPSNPHNFRHSAITNMVNIGMQQNAICMRFWGSPSSNMLDTYIHLSESSQADSYLKAKGLIGNEVKVMNPLAVRCISCGKLIQKGSLCVQCEENAQLKIKMAKMENQITTLNDMYQTIMQSEMENSVINNFAEAKKRKK